MHAVGLNEQGQTPVVIDDAHHTQFAASLNDAARLLQRFLGCCRFASPLECGHAACGGGLECREHARGVAPLGRNAVQPSWEAQGVCRARGVARMRRSWIHGRLRLKMRAPMPGWNTRPAIPLTIATPRSIARGSSVPCA